MRIGQAKDDLNILLPPLAFRFRNLTSSLASAVKRIGAASDSTSQSDSIGSESSIFNQLGVFLTNTTEIGGIVVLALTASCSDSTTQGRLPSSFPLHRRTVASPTS